MQRRFEIALEFFELRRWLHFKLRKALRRNGLHALKNFFFKQAIRKLRSLSFNKRDGTREQIMLNLLPRTDAGPRDIELIQPWAPGITAQ